MTYYRIKKTSDQKRREDNSILIANELYTAGELKKYKISEKHYEPVEISQRKTYWCFGARFESTLN